MFRELRVNGLYRAGLLALALLGVPACSEPPPLDGAGVKLTPPEGWREVDRSTWPVPGRPLGAWAGPGGSSLVVYQTLAVPGGRADELLTEQTIRLENMPGLKLEGKRVETVGGLPAAWVEAVAPGTGDALAATGMGTPVAPAGKALVPTRRVLVTLPRPADTVSLVWHAPEGEAAALRSQVDATLRTLTVQKGRAPAAASY